MYSLLALIPRSSARVPSTNSRFRRPIFRTASTRPATAGTFRSEKLSFPTVSMGRQVTQQLNRQDKLQFRDDSTVAAGHARVKVGADYVRFPAFAVYQDRDGNGNLTFFDDPSVILRGQGSVSAGVPDSGGRSAVQRLGIPSAMVRSSTRSSSPHTAAGRLEGDAATLAEPRPPLRRECQLHQRNGDGQQPDVRGAAGHRRPERRAAEDRHQRHLAAGRVFAYNVRATVRPWCAADTGCTTTP